jgi:hypothetical protein
MQVVKVRDASDAPAVTALASAAGRRLSARVSGGGLALPLPRARTLSRGLRLPRPLARALAHRTSARVALAVLLLGAFSIALFAATGPSVLVPRSPVAFPNWESGPLHSLIGRPVTDRLAISIGMSVLTVVMLLAYLVLLGAARTLSMRLIAGCVFALHAILLLGPPLPLTDIFNYIGYARLGGLHGVNPYVHGIGMAPHDPIYRFTTWHHLKSPYGPLFTFASYGLAHLSLPAAYWIAKTVTVLAGLVFVALVWKCARLLGRDGRYAVLFVAANPVFLVYEIAGFLNDLFMLVPATGAIALLLMRRDRWAGAALMLAVAVKFTAILLLPFLLLAARPTRRRAQLLIGAGAAAIPLAAMNLAVFGPRLPNLSDQSTLLTDFSIPNMVGWLLGLGGGAPVLVRAANVLLVLVVALLLRRRGPWLESAGWATLALIATLAWLVPWYVVWALPLAALGSSLRLRRWAIALTVYLVLTFMPAMGPFLRWRHIDPMRGAPGQASKALQTHLGG